MTCAIEIGCETACKSNSHPLLWDAAAKAKAEAMSKAYAAKNKAGPKCQLKAEPVPMPSFAKARPRVKSWC